MVQNKVFFSFGTMMGLPSINIKGPFDFIDAEIDSWVDDQISSHHEAIILDLSDCHYITAYGVATIFKIVKKISSTGGILHISGATEDMLEIITLAKLDRYVSIIVNQ